MNKLNKNIQLIDLAAQQNLIYPELEKRIRSVLSHGKYIMGPEIAELEKVLADFSGVKHCISCSSGTDALLMALMAKNIGPGDAVFTTPFTFIATAETVSLLGGTPVFVDIDPKTFNLNPAKLELAIKAVKENDPSIYPIPGSYQINNTTKIEKLVPRGIIPVDLFGLPADYQRINSIAEEHNLFVIEDAAQSFGAMYKGKRTGCLTDIAATSFFPAKPLGCYGDGGAIFTDNDDLASILESIRVHGKGAEKYDNIRIGINGRLDTLQAAILLEKFKIFPTEIEARNHVANRYSKNLEGYLTTPFVPDGSMSVWAQYSVLIHERGPLMTTLKKENIPTAIYYPKPLHLQTAFMKLGYKKGDFPVAEATSEQIFSLPMHPYLTDEELDRIAEVIASNHLG